MKNNFLDILFVIFLLAGIILSNSFISIDDTTTEHQILKASTNIID